MMADALAPHGGVVMWRAFVYSDDGPEDRINQAYDEFEPLDGKFRDNVMVQVKNGPLDFQPREPFSPLFGAMPSTPWRSSCKSPRSTSAKTPTWPTSGPLYEEVLKSDTFAAGPGSTVAKVIDGSLHNTRSPPSPASPTSARDRNWSGSHFNQANWYVFGRLAWNPDLVGSRCRRRVGPADVLQRSGRRRTRGS